MTCRCGSYVCWACLRPVTEHKAGDICQNITGEVYPEIVHYYIITGCQKAVGYYGPARAGPLYEIKI